MRVAAAIVLTAMPEEAAPFLEAAERSGAKVGHLSTPGNFEAWSLDLIAPRILLVQTGIGHTATASALTWALDQVSTKDVIMVGTAGGVHPEVNIGDVVVGSSYRYSEADATAFGYAYGQVPGQPESFDGSERLISEATQLEFKYPVRPGLMVSSDAFVAESRLNVLRSRFPEALSADMESVAAAQVAHSFGVTFTAVRAITDKCGPKADEEHALTLDESADRACHVALRLLATLSRGGRRFDRRRKSFGVASLTAALYLIIAIDNDLEPADPSKLDLDHHDLYQDLYENQYEQFAGLITAGQEFVRSNEDTRLTSQRYDQIRGALIKQHDLEGGRGRQTWPPTSQTIMKRFDGLWNKALDSIGVTGASGRRPGGLRYTDADYKDAIRQYRDWAVDSGRNPSYAGYQAWLKNQSDTHPSGASVRQHFGTWADAILSLYESGDMQH